MNCFTVSAATCLTLACLAGCSPPNWDAPFENYLARLARTLGQDVPASAFPFTPERMPRPAELKYAFTGNTLDGIDFLALHGCQLQVTIGRRNSSLGRMATASQRLLLELEYLQLAPACITRLRDEGKADLAGVLETAWHNKRGELPQRIFNATLAEDEFRRFWRPRPPVPDYPASTSSAIITALEQLTGMARRWLGGDYRFDNREFELLLSEVSGGDGGMLWRALAVQAAWLQRADAVLRERNREGPLCGPRYRPDSAEILPNVVARFFIGAIQPRAAALGRRRHQLYAPLRELEELLGPALPAAYRAWLSARDASLERIADAPRQHVHWLQQTLEPCGGRPTAGS